MKSRTGKNAHGLDRHRRNLAGYILTGGASSRFGRDKALAEIGGLTMAARMVLLFRKLSVPGIWFVGEPTKYGHLGTDCLADLWPGEGPLGGILTGLQNTDGLSRSTTADYNLIASCDMPFLNEGWIEELVGRAFESDAQVVVAKSATGLEPLCAVWRTDALQVVQRAFDSGVRKVTEAMKQLPMEVLDESVWKRFDTHNRLFWNMNTPEDYEEARRILEGVGTA
jgi:molybdopterin-guanine dinucleotide biosynthesis protein A